MTTKGLRLIGGIFFVAVLVSCNTDNPVGPTEEEGWYDWGVGGDDNTPLPDYDRDGFLPDSEGGLPDSEGILPDFEGVLPDSEGVLPDHEGVLPDTETVIPDGADVSVPDENVGDEEGPDSDEPETDVTVTDDGGSVFPDADIDMTNCECLTGACCDGCHLRGNDFVCRSATGECDLPEYCTGASPDCPIDLFVDANQPCGSQASGPCNDPDTCDGAGHCLPNYWSENTPCDDGVFCNGSDTCNAYGGCTMHSGDPCTGGTTCMEGKGCLTECELAEATESYVGCEYWGAFLQNSVTYYDGSTTYEGNYAVVVANPNDTAVTVTVYGNGDTQLAQFTVNPGQINSQVFDLSRLIPSAGIFDYAYKIVSSRPVTVTQMNPFGNVLTYSNDASLLLPKGALGLQYYAMSWPSWHYFESGGGCDSDTEFEHPGFVTIVATEPGTTTVTVTYAADSRAGTGVVAQSAGSTATYALNQYQVLVVNAAAPSCGSSTCYGPDLTGSFIEADKKIAVFGGHYCTFVPADQWACDHLEHQLFPLRSWGKDFVVVRTRPRNTEADYFRILAAQDGTTVSWTGGISGNVTLNAGQFHEFSTTADFVVTADKPIMIAQILASQDAGAGTGDPAMMLIAPSEQFRKDYIFLVAPNYDYDRLTLVAQPDTNIVIDGTSLNSNSFTPIPGTNWLRQYLDSADGAHKLTSDKPVGLYVYGFSQYVSYAYTAGLDLVEIYSCWDLNNNGVCDVATEDQSGDGICNERDC